jgi:TetR/AcrR family transcriptional regulator
MAARGADATSLRVIADEVGIRKPSIMYHFESKNALRKAVLEELLTRWSEVIPRLIVATAQNGLARFEALTRELIDFFSEDPDRARLIFREMMDRPTEMQTYLTSYVRPWIKVITEQIQTSSRDGDIDPNIDPDAFVWVMINAVIGNIALSSAFGEATLTNEQIRANNNRLTNELVRMARSSLFHPKHLIKSSSEPTETANA